MGVYNRELILQNEKEINEKAVKYLAFVTLFLPLLIILNVLNIFILSPYELTIISLSGVVLFLSPLIFYKLGLSHNKLKYIIVSVLILFGFATYTLVRLNAIFFIILPVAIALMYFDNKLMKYTVFLNFTSFLLADYFACYLGGSIIYLVKWYPLHFFSFLIQFIIIIPIFLSTAKRANNMLNKMNENIININTMMEASELTSKNLFEMVNELLVSSHENNKAFQNIGENMQNMTNLSNDSVIQIQETCNIFDLVNNKINNISQEINETSTVSKNISLVSVKIKDSIEKCIQNIENLKCDINSSKDKVEKLEEKSKEIANTIEMITDIAEKTKLLSLNASIEAARAGEFGKGFAVVATEVRRLSEMSEFSSRKIKEIVKSIISDINEVVLSIESNYNSVNDNVSTINKVKENFIEFKKIETDINEYLKTVRENMSNLVLLTKEAKENFDAMLNIANGNFDKIADVSSTVEELIATNEMIVSYIDAISEEAKKLSKR